jgi:hypothetical protein
MIHYAIDGAVLAVTQKFIDEDSEQPLLAAPGYPQVKLIDAEKNRLSSTIGSPTAIPGEWSANISIPNLGVADKTELRLIWRFLTTDNERIVEKDVVVVEPRVESRVSDIVAVFGDQKFALTLPVYFGGTDTAEYYLYRDNDMILSAPGNLADTALYQRTTTVDRTNFLLPLNVPNPSLQAYLVRVDVVPCGVGHKKTFTYKLWAVTPQIMKGMSFLEDFLNKAKIENTIPELQYTDGDLINYLERGLNLFNMVGSMPTAFTGTNMQGVLFDAWVTCASYYALGAQLMAEGALAFDFSGQGISLNVDRTPQLDSALGRIESMIDSRIVPLKKALQTQGVTSGDGSVGKTTMRNSANLGTLGLTNAATTRIRGVQNTFVGKRW